MDVMILIFFSQGEVGGEGCEEHRGHFLWQGAGEQPPWLKHLVGKS